MRQSLEERVPSAAAWAVHGTWLTVSAVIAAIASLMVAREFELFVSKSGWDGVGQVVGWVLIGFIWGCYILYTLVTSIIYKVSKPRAIALTGYHVLFLLGIPTLLTGLLWLLLLT